MTLKASALSLGYLTEDEFDRWVRPEEMVGSLPYSLASQVQPRDQEPERLRLRFIAILYVLGVIV